MRTRAVAAVGLLAALLGCAPQAPEAGAPPDIVVVLIDTLRADRVGTYGDERAHTPRIDALAELGVVFEQATAPAPWTLPSLASLFTSRLPGEHNVVLGKYRLSSELPTLAERLREAGYATASFYSNPFAGPRSGMDRGFDHAEMVPEQTGGERVARWLAGVDSPAFVYVHNTEPHDPHLARGRYLARHGDVGAAELAAVDREWRVFRQLTRVDSDRKQPVGTTDNSAEQIASMARLEALADEIGALYAARVSEADARVGDLVSTLGRIERWDNTLFVLLSDHGEEMGEHGGWQHDQSVYQELLHVPLVVRFPQDRHAGRRVAEPVSLLDVLPTVLAVAGRPDLVGDVRGRDLEALLSAGGAEEPRLVAMRINRKKYFRPFKETRGDRNVVVRQGSWKAVLNLEPGTLELYDLAADPGERRDLAAERPELAGDLQSFALAELERMEQTALPAESVATGLDEAARERLRALGYLAGPGDGESPEQ